MRGALGDKRASDGRAVTEYMGRRVDGRVSQWETACMSECGWEC